MSPTVPTRVRDITKIFLETTVQIERFLESPERRAEIRFNLLGKKLYTSSYVLMEFQRTLIKDLEFVRSIISSDCPANFDGRILLHDLMSKLRRRGPGHSERSVLRTLIVVERILEIFEEGAGKIKKTLLLQYLADQIAALRQDFLEVDLTEEGGEVVTVEYINLTDCDLAKTRQCHCRREEARCSLPRLLGQHAELVKQVRDAFETERSTKASMPSAVARVVHREPADWQRAKGQRNCWPLGDTIIALESPHDAAIYTTDHHYDVICPVVGRLLYQEAAAR